MRPIVALAIGILAGFATPAQAITCGKASSAVEHLICGDKRLQHADAAMGEAYVAILKATDDPEIRAMLVKSQKRWLKARDSSLGEVFGFIAENLDEKPGKAVVQRNLLAAIRDRTQALTARSTADPKIPRLIEVALGQRKLVAQYTGGPFAGIDADCGFFPYGMRDAGPYSYLCFAERIYQNKNRVCTLSQYWATYRVYEKYEIADVVGGELKTIASCGDNGHGCPSPDGSPGDRSDWDMQVDVEADSKDTSSKPSAQPQSSTNVVASSKLDADAGLDEEEPWLRACLTDPAYPHAAPTSSDSTKPR